MLKSLVKILVMSLALFSAASYAEKITITGEPVVVTKQNNVYVVPSSYTTSGDYYYVTMGDSKRVCYKTVQPSLAKVDLGVFNFRVGNDTVEMHCYNTSPDYFIVQ